MSDTNSAAANHFTIDQDLYDLLADVTHSSHLNNQILQVLEHGRITCWNHFYLIDHEEVEEYTTREAKRGCLGIYFARKLQNLTKLIAYNRNNGCQDWNDISVYTHHTVREFGDRIRTINVPKSSDQFERFHYWDLNDIPNRTMSSSQGNRLLAIALTHNSDEYSTQCFIAYEALYLHPKPKISPHSAGGSIHPQALPPIKAPEMICPPSTTEGTNSQDLPLSKNDEVTKTTLKQAINNSSTSVDHKTPKSTHMSKPQLCSRQPDACSNGETFTFPPDSKTANYRYPITSTALWYGMRQTNLLVNVISTTHLIGESYFPPTGRPPGFLYSQLICT